jgi:hypothetical protein
MTIFEVQAKSVRVQWRRVTLSFRLPQLLECSWTSDLCYARTLEPMLAFRTPDVQSWRDDHDQSHRRASSVRRTLKISDSFHDGTYTREHQ